MALKTACAAMGTSDKLYAGFYSRTLFPRFGGYYLNINGK